MCVGIEGIEYMADFRRARNKRSAFRSLRSAVTLQRSKRKVRTSGFPPPPRLDWGDVQVAENAPSL